MQVSNECSKDIVPLQYHPVIEKSLKESLEQTFPVVRQLVGDEFFASGLYEESRRLFETVAIDPHFQEFLTLPAYELID